MTRHDTQRDVSRPLILLDFISCRIMLRRMSTALLLACLSVGHSFSLSSTTMSRHQHRSSPLQALTSSNSNENNSQLGRLQFVQTLALSGLLAASSLVLPAQASEIGIEVEAPTMYTGENVMVRRKKSLVASYIKHESPAYFPNEWSVCLSVHSDLQATWSPRSLLGNSGANGRKRQ